MSQRPAFSLLEVVISLLLVVSVFVIVMNAVVSAFRDNRAQQSAMAATDAAQQVVRSTVSMIRQAVSSPTGAYPIVAATNTSLTFYTANGDTVELVRIFLSGTELRIGRTQLGSAPNYLPGTEVVTTLLANVRNGAQPVFQYYNTVLTAVAANTNYNGTQVAMNPIVINTIRLVRVTIIFDDKPTEPPAAATIELQAQLRNLKDNY